MADTLSWWELYKQDLTAEFKKLAHFGAQTAAAATRADEHWSKLVSIWERAKSDWEQFTEGRNLDEVRVNGVKLTSLVCIVRDAEEILEEYRLNRLKEKLDEARSTVLDAINEMKTGAGVAPGVGEDVGPMAELMVRIDDFMTQVERILEAILSIAELFDVVTNTEKEIEKKALPQGNPRTKISDPGFHWSRR